MVMVTTDMVQDIQVHPPSPTVASHRLLRTIQIISRLVVFHLITHLVVQFEDTSLAVNSEVNLEEILTGVNRASSNPVEIIPGVRVNQASSSQERNLPDGSPRESRQAFNNQAALRKDQPILADSNNQAEETLYSLDQDRTREDSNNQMSE